MDGRKFAIIITRPKWHNTIDYWNIYQFTTVLEICRNLQLFWYLSLRNLSFEFNKKFSSKFEGYFFKVSKLKELEYYRKLEFLKLKYQKSSRFLHISETIVD